MYIYLKLILFPNPMNILSHSNLQITNYTSNLQI